MGKKTEPEEVSEEVELKDFEIKFYDGMMRFGKVIANITGSSISYCKPIRDKKGLRIELLIDAKDGTDIPPTKILNEVKRMSTHFIVFYTPAHYRPQPNIEVEKVKYKHEILVTGRFV